MVSINEYLASEELRLSLELDAVRRAKSAAMARPEPSIVGARAITSPATPRAKAAAKAAPKRVRSEATKAKHKATLAAKRAAANGAHPTEPAPALDAE
jgi:hypothetical protein